MHDINQQLFKKLPLLNDENIVSSKFIDEGR